MKQLLLAAGMFALGAGSVAAQDQVPDWSGLYVGIFGGAAEGDALYANIANSTRYEGDIAGALFGARAGYRYQFSPVVLGVSASAAVANIDGRGTDGVDSANYDVSWLATVDAQLGLSADRLLIYGVAGGALVGLQHDYDSIASFDVSYSRRTHAGYSIGGGVEYAFSDNVSAWLEARYFDFGKKTFQQVADVIPHTLDTKFDTVTIGLNIKF